LSKSNDFNITEDAQIFSLLPSITWQEMHRYYEYSNELIAQRDDESLPNLQFDTSSSVEEKDEPCDLSAIFRSGIVPVVHLSAKGYNIYDIETIMIYTILHKKKKYTRQEFVGFNKNHLGDLLDPMDNQVKHAFQYMVCRAQPETRKVQRLIYTPMWRACWLTMLKTTLSTLPSLPGDIALRPKRLPDTRERQMRISITIRALSNQ